jgi:hypothetical protein
VIRPLENPASPHLNPLPKGEETRFEEAFFLLLPLGEDWDEVNTWRVSSSLLAPMS